MWDWNKAFTAFVSGLLLPGFVGESPWITELWNWPDPWTAAIVAVLTWLVPNGVPFWQVWRGSE